MKKIIIAATIAITALFVTAPEAEAGPRFNIQIGGGGGHHHGGCDRRPAYVVRTYEIDRHCHKVVSYYRPCGAPVYRHVTVVTYRQVYSNGYSRTYTRTLG